MSATHDRKANHAMGKIILAVFIIAVIIVIIMRSRHSGEAAQFNKSQGQTFLQENLKTVGVEATDSGLQYEKLTSGNGTEHPKPTDRVQVHYHGTLIDGTVFDSSVDRGEPITFGLNQVIKGWTEGLQLMVEGDKFHLTIPNELAYGNRGAGAIPPGSVLIFEVELLKINP